MNSDKKLAIWLRKRLAKYLSMDDSIRDDLWKLVKKLEQ